MKLLFCFFFFPAFLIPCISRSQDKAFTLRGNIQQPSSFSSFLIAYPGTMDSIPIRADGSFLYSGSFSEPGVMQIGTRTTGIRIWLDNRLKNVYLSEKPGRSGKMVLTVDSVLGSEDTYLYYSTLLPKEIKTDIALTKIQVDSLWKSNSLRKVDSIFKVRPDSKVLPWLISYYAPSLGADYMQEFYYRLTTEQQQSKYGRDLLNELNKLQLLKPGNSFEDFSMEDDHGKKFQFSSLKTKYVLIDFWASWCGPCRAIHPYLREAYLKAGQTELEIISISLDEDRQKWLHAIQEDKLTWINLSDLKGRDNAVALKYKITGIPFSVLLDENRKIILVDPTTDRIIDFFKNLKH